MRGFLFVVVVSASLLSVADAQTPVSADHARKMQQGLTLFRDNVRGILEEHCLKCHNARSKKADFDLSTRKALMDSGYVGATAEDSYLLQLVRHEEEPHMPLKGGQAWRCGNCFALQVDRAGSSVRQAHGRRGR